MDSSQTTPDRPSPSEVEISLFGPSYGESIAIHACEGSWILVDSCFVPGTKISRPLQYLSQLGLNPSPAVKLIVATHWDDDHIGGLAQCVEACPEADFVMSAAISTEEFVTIVRVLNGQLFGKSKIVSEFAEILELLNNRGRRPKLALENTTLWATAPGTSPQARLVALSPSSSTTIQGHIDISALLNRLQNRISRVSFGNRNDRSVVLFLEVARATAMFGSDLEETGDHRTGWAAILNSSLTYPKAQVFKVAHHGSEDADKPGVWDSLLCPRPPTLVAPWHLGSRSLPTPEDLKRLLTRTDRLYVTTIPQNRRKERTREIQNLLDADGIRLRVIDQSSGQIRVRADIKSDRVSWREHLSGGAKHITGRMYRAFPSSA